MKVPVEEKDPEPVFFDGESNLIIFVDSLAVQGNCLWPGLDEGDFIAVPGFGHCFQAYSGSREPECDQTIQREEEENVLEHTLGTKVFFFLGLEPEFSLDPRKHTSGPRKTSDLKEIAVRLSCRPAGRGQRWFSGDFLFLVSGFSPRQHLLRPLGPEKMEEEIVCNRW